MGYACIRKMNGDYFVIQKVYRKEKRNKPYLYILTDKLKINDYYIYKYTGKFHQVSTKEFFDFKYAGYVFFRKELYEKKWLDIWIDWTNKNTNITYLVKPFPPFNPQKIKIYQRWVI